MAGYPTPLITHLLRLSGTAALRRHSGRGGLEQALLALERARILRERGRPGIPPCLPRLQNRYISDRTVSAAAISDTVSFSSTATLISMGPYCV